MHDQLGNTTTNRFYNQVINLIPASYLMIEHWCVNGVSND
jgi:hypothetical protein